MKQVAAQLTTVWSRAPVSVIAAAAGLIGLGAHLLCGWRCDSWFGLHAGDIYSPLCWYRFLTFPILHVGVVHWAWNSTLLILVGMIIEPRIARSYITTLMLASSALAGIIFSMTAQPYGVLMGMGAFVNAYTGCLFACYLLRKSSFTTRARILTGFLVTLEFLHLAVGLAWIQYGMNTGLLKWIVLLTSFLASWTFYRRIERENANTGLHCTADRCAVSRQ